TDMPIAKNLSITLSMSFIPAFMLPIWRSVEMESGRNPSFIAGTAIRHKKLPPPWPTSKITPRFLASQSAGFTLPDSTCSLRKPGKVWGIDTPRSELGGHESTEGPFSMINPKADHDGDMGERPRLDSAFNRRPFRAGVVGRLDAYDQTLIAKRHVRRRLGFHV